MRRAILILFSLIVILVPFISSCDAGEVQQFIYWGKLWAIVHDITDEEGNPNLGAIARFTAGEAMGFATTGDDEADAVIDNARVLKNIRLAEEEGDKGWKALTDGDPARIHQDVIPHYNKAVDLRPNDWAYLNERAIAHLEDELNPDSLTASEADFIKATQLASKGGKPEEYIRMLKHREQALSIFVDKKRATGYIVSHHIYLEQISTYKALYEMTGNSDYIILRQRAEDNLGYNPDEVGR